MPGFQSFIYFIFYFKYHIAGLSLQGLQYTSAAVWNAGFYFPRSVTFFVATWEWQDSAPRTLHTTVVILSQPLTPIRLELIFFPLYFFFSP